MASTSAAEPSSAMKESRNWLEMPHELMVNICQRLPTLEILKRVRKVCKTWQRICKYPAMWKVIEIRTRHDINSMDECEMLSEDSNWDYGLETLTKEAVNLSCGELIDVWIEWFCTDKLLNHVVLHSKNLKRLCLISCFRITNFVLSEAAKRVPQLEILQIDDMRISPDVIEVFGRNCPHLKSFSLSVDVMRSISIKWDDYALAIANSMPQLLYLKPLDRAMSNDGLQAILDGCPNLQSLDVRKCHNLDLDGDLGKLCKERIKDFKYDPVENRWFPLQMSDSEDFSESDSYEYMFESDSYEDMSEGDSHEDTSEGDSHENMSEGGSLEDTSEGDSRDDTSEGDSSEV